MITFGSTFRALATLAAVAVLSGCANLEAVRDFSASSARLTGYKDVTARYLTTADRRVFEFVDTPDNVEQARLLLAYQKELAQQKDSLLKLHNVSTGYMAVLAVLAGEKTFDVSAQIDQVSGAIVAIPDLGINADHVNAFAAIAKTVTSWLLTAKQAREVKSLVRENGDSMDRLLEAMQFAASNYQRVLDGERLSLITSNEIRQGFWTKPIPSATGGTDLRGLLVLQLSRRSDAVAVKEATDAVAAAKAAHAGIVLIRSGHDEMRKNVEHLSDEQVLTALKRLAGELKEVRDNLKTLSTNGSA